MLCNVGDRKIVGNEGLRQTAEAERHHQGHRQRSRACHGNPGQAVTMRAKQRENAKQQRHHGGQDQREMSEFGNNY